MNTAAAPILFVMSESCPALVAACDRDGGLPFMKRESVYNQFYSDLITPLEENIAVPGTTVHCFYAEKMGEKYLHRYYKHFADPVIHRFDMEHEELLVLYPEQWVEEIKHCCGAL